MRKDGNTMKFRKKPVIIEAELYRPGLEDGFELFVKPGRIDGKPVPIKTERPYINTLEGKHYISEGDWIITGIKGERYPCKPDIFEATYEIVDEKETL